MKEHVNFYENLREAQMRINRTVVLYDGDPYYVLSTTDHRSDGIFRVYLWPIGLNRANTPQHYYPSFIDNYPADHPGLGGELDKFMDTAEGKKNPMIRKQMNSPKFNRFRPFPLGMANFDGQAVYLERSPQRRTEQGLTSAMLRTSICALETSRSSPKFNVDMLGWPLADCIKGVYPTANECLTNLLDSSILNTSAAFHRQFALVRGPMNLIFVSYKTDVIGMLPYKNMAVLLLDSDFVQLRESIEELNVFGTVQT